MAKAPRLKVYASRLGFFETVVAAPNQTAALEAWGVHRNLFADGSAAAATDAAAVAAAEQSPGVVLRRPIGSTQAYTADAAAALNLPDAPKSRSGERATSTAAPPKPKPKPDRSALTTAEREAAAITAENEEALRQIDRERKALEARAQGLQRDFDRRLEAAAKALSNARAAFVKSGGKP